MTSEWPKIPVSEACELIVDCVNKTAPTVSYETPYKMIRTTNIRNGRIDLSTTKFVTEDTYTKWTRRATVEPGDVLLTREAPLGEVGMVREKDTIFLGQRIMQYRANTKVLDPRFLFYSFCSRDLQNQFHAHGGSGSVVDHIRVGDCHKFLIPLPTLDEQKAIAHILGTLDDKIELNQQMNRTLEAIARALFKSWFIDFDPVRAKLDGRQPAGMDAETAALFPAEFEDGGAIGKIPRGWKVGRLEDLIVLQRGFDLPKTARTPGKYPVLAASGPSGTHSEYKVKGPGVTTGRSGVLGNVFFVHEDFWPLNTSLWVKEFRHSRPIHAYHLLRGLNFEVFNAGSAVPTLNRNHVHGLPVIDAPLSVIEKFEEIVKPIFKQCRANEEQTVFISSLRDALLPKLLSGEIRVKEAKKIVAEVA